MDQKKLIIIGGSVIGGLIAILIIVYIISSLKPSYYTYEELEEKLIAISKEFYKANPNMLPVSDGEHILNYSTLVDNELINPLNEVLENSEGCSATISVIKDGENYSYAPYINCPEYTTKELYKAILEDNQTQETLKGLFQENSTYVFKGEVDNNYLTFSSSDAEKKDYWRIIKINPDNTILIVQDTYTLSERYIWDNRYNEDRKASYGYNDFEISRIKDTLKSLGNSEKVLTEVQKSKLTAKNLCIGKRSENETNKDSTVECSKLSTDKYIFGLLIVGDIMNASADKNCIYADSRSCTNYNYLTDSSASSWTLTATTESSYKIYTINNDGPGISSAYTNKRLRLTANVSNKAMYKSGNGTKEDPYVIR